MPDYDSSENRADLLIRLSLDDSWRSSEYLVITIEIHPRILQRELQELLDECGVMTRRHWRGGGGGGGSSGGGGGSWGQSIELLVAFVGAGGAGTALAVALHKFIDRHKHKKITYSSDGKLLEVNGYSYKDAKRLIKTDISRQKRLIGRQKNEMATVQDPTVQRRRLRMELRRARDAAGLKQADVARAMNWSPSKLIRIETGYWDVSSNDLKALLSHYGVKDKARVNKLLELARSTRGPGSFYENRNFDN